MPNRLKFVVSYDGAPFAGWQSQPNGNTVQDHLETAFTAIIGERVRVHGAGRTDAGVHALAQTVHADVPKRALSADAWPGALNASLPPTIRVLRCHLVPDSFHARFSAKGKVYRYRIWNGRILPPLELNRAWHIAAPVDVSLLTAAAEEFRGRHDFAGYAANRGKPEENTLRTIDGVRVRSRGKLLTLEVSGDGFLYKMVRLMTGAIVRCGLGRSTPAEIRERLIQPMKVRDTIRTVAPAGGLFLVRVRY